MVIEYTLGRRQVRLPVHDRCHDPRGPSGNRRTATGDKERVVGALL